MPSWTDRLAGGLSGVAVRVEQIARAVRGPNTSARAPIPGQPSDTSATGRPGEALWEALRSFGAYTGRIAPALGPTNARWSTNPADDLTPVKIIEAQRAAVGGYPQRWVDMIEEVHGRDGHFASVSNQRVADVIKGTWSLRPAKSDELSAAILNFTLDAYQSCSRFRDGLGWLLFGNLYGFNAVEIEWEERVLTFAGPGGKVIGPIRAVVPRRLWAVHPKHFRFDLNTDDPLLWTQDGGERLPFGKFVFLEGEGLQPVTVRHGYSWQCVWYSMFRSIGWAGWATFVDRFAMPIPIIEYRGDQTQFNEWQQAYQDILVSLGSGKGAMVPSDAAKLELKDPPRGGGSSDPHSALSSACDAAQSVRVLGATLTNSTGNTGSFAQAEVHGRVKEALEEQDAARLWERIDEQLTTALLAFNAEPLAIALNRAGLSCTPEMVARRVPRGAHVVPTDLDTQTRFNILVKGVNDLGLEVSRDAVYHRFDFPRPTSPDDVLAGKPTDVQKGAAVVGAVEAAQGASNPDPADAAPPAAAPATNNEKPEPSAPPSADAAPQPQPTDAPGAGQTD